jgi:hypothetical protein
MKTKLLLILLVMFDIVVGQTNPNKVILNEKENSLNVISATSNDLTIEIVTNNFNKIPEVIENKEFNILSLNHESFIKEKGYPELPKIVRDISIPVTSTLKVDIVKSEYVDMDLPVIPSKGILYRNVNPRDIPYTFSEIYSKDRFFPEKQYKIGEPYFIRNVRGSSITIYPFAYNPLKKVLRIYTRLVIEISFEETDVNNTNIHRVNKKNKYFDPIFKNHFINYEQVNINNNLGNGINNIENSTSTNTNNVDEIGKMLIITYDNFYNDILPFASYKDTTSLPTQVVKMSSIGSTSTQIYNYIKNSYDSDNTLTFVLLVGDHAQVPSMIFRSGGSDPSYSLVSGNDDYPDIIVGRFSAETNAQVTTMVNRSIMYENMTEQSWFHKGIGIASDDGPGDDGEYDYQHVRNIRTELLNYHYSSVDELYDGSQGGQDAAGDPTVAMVSSSVNNGASIINYTGHGNYDRWMTSNFTNTNVNALTNDNKLPFIFSVACQNGNFTGYTCFSETWLRATNNSTSNATGAIAFYGSSVNQGWDPPMKAQDQFNSLLISDSYFTFGALCFNAALGMMSAYGQEGIDEFKNWNIFGDPSLTVIPHKPCSEISVTGVINTDTTYIGCEIIVSNAVITNNAHVIFDAVKETTINNDFELQLGSTLEIK